MKKLMIYIVIMLNSLIAVAGVVYCSYLFTLDDIYITEITVETGEVVTKEEVHVRRLTLNPSESQRYSAVFNCHTSGNFEFVLNFEKVRASAIQDSMQVVVEADDSVVYEGTLKDLFTQRSIYFEDRIRAGEPYEIVTTYSLPADADNGILNSIVQFDMNINLYAT